MRVVVHDFGGYSFSAQLARTLAHRGHEVLYLQSRGFRPDKDPLSGRGVNPPNLSNEAIDIGRSARGALALGRLADERRYGRQLARRLAQFRPTVVISANCPVDAQASAQASAHGVGAGFVFWLQDIYSEAVRRILAGRVPVAGRLIGARFARIERRVLRDSDAIVSITTDFLPVLRRWGIPAGRTTVIENWAPLDLVRPGEKRNAWSEEQGLADIPVFLYAGTLGRKHDPGLLLALARGLPEALVVVVSQGAGTDLLRRQPDLNSNLRMLPLQPAQRLSEVLASADVLVVLLDEDAGAFSVPSKVLTYLTAERPILGAMPLANLAARTILEIGAGRVVPPSDPEGFVIAAKELLNAPAERSRAGSAGRGYAANAFEIDPIADRFEEILERASSRTARRLGNASGRAWQSTTAQTEKGQ